MARWRLPGSIFKLYHFCRSPRVTSSSLCPVVTKLRLSFLRLPNAPQRMHHFQFYFFKYSLHSYRNLSYLSPMFSLPPQKYFSLLPLPIYAGLPTPQQLLVFQPPPSQTRKVIVATNIAEASITVDGIVYVIDNGFVKLRAYNPRTGLEALTTVPVSRAAAQQRAGRAGRTRPGKAFRLYTEEAYQGLREANVPEMQRSNLATVVLQLKALGIENVARFEFLTAPPAELMTRALEVCDWREFGVDGTVVGGSWHGYADSIGFLIVYFSFCTRWAHSTITLGLRCHWGCNWQSFRLILCWGRL